MSKLNLFSTEQVSKYHPDKYADQISDAILTELKLVDPTSRVAVETAVKGTNVVLLGEVTTKREINYENIVKRVSSKLNYEVTKVINLIESQSPEIFNGIKEQGTDEIVGAGDQGMMFGYATRETESYLPYGFDLANKIIALIEHDVDTNPLKILKGDAKTQVTVDLNVKQDINAVKTILVSACHNFNITLEYLNEHLRNVLSPLLKDYSGKLLINPAGSWTMGGPLADAGLTGRKIVADQFGGYRPVGGGAFSGKDPSKVDRSAAYLARYVAVEILKEFKEYFDCEVQVAYAIGISEPVSLHIITDGKNASDEVYEFVKSNFDFRPKEIIKKLNLLNLNYGKLAEGCHYRPNGGL